MKNISVYSLALLLVLGTSVALAGQGYSGYVGAHYGLHNVHHKYSRNSYYQQRHHRPRQQRYYYPRSYYFPEYFGAVVLGSALSYSLYHMHRGTVCYDRHNGRDYRGNYHNDVVGCHRIEQLRDGSQRRVNVPLSQCY